MKSQLATICRYALTFLGLLLLFNATLYLVCSFSSQQLGEHAVAAFDTMEKQESERVFSQALRIINSNDADALIINELCSVNSSEPVISYLKGRRNHRPTNNKEIKDLEAIDAVIAYSPKDHLEYINNDDSNQLEEFGQYLDNKIHTTINCGYLWHGYFILYRPLLALFSLTVTRVISLALLCGLFVCFLRLIRKRFSRTTAIIYGGTLALSGYFTAAISLQCAPLFLTMMICAVVFLKRLDHWHNPQLFFFVSACLTNFFDTLTVPELSLGLLLSLYLMKLLQDGKSSRQVWRSLLVSTALWLLGYFLTWVSKWAIYDAWLGTGSNMLQAGWHRGILRITAHTFITYFTEAKRMSFTIDIMGRAALYAVPIAWLVLHLHKYQTRAISGFNPRILPYLALAFLPVLWRFICSYQTIHGHLFSYRSGLIFSLGLLLALREMFAASTPPGADEQFLKPRKPLP